ncbi:hypothetical protein IP90_01462 [Luteimonas cucumeris]|uniref:Uncharacterized protein n=1 Tax=Luteimonas cucumeris TaxID=985012 RepID=A0A562L7P8_9GAMM|nr:hypothetical protein [Luteimonas cucumeris]TWI03648.1 hypothetical protein IP90_01462 [Luteimonas cucumeris]
MTHSQLRDRSDMISVAGGWHAHLGILADRLHEHTPPGFWSTHAWLEAEYKRQIPVD